MFHRLVGVAAEVDVNKSRRALYSSPVLCLTDGGAVVAAAALGGGVLEVLDEHAGEAEGDVVVLGAGQDRREALLVGRREVGAAPQQQLRRLHQAARRGQVQRTKLLC